MPKVERVAEEALREVLEITIPDFPLGLAFVGAPINYLQWCDREVKRIAKIPGHSPRIKQHRNRARELTGKILIVDDEYVLPPHNSHSDAVIIRRYHKTRKQWS